MCQRECAYACVCAYACACARVRVRVLVRVRVRVHVRVRVVRRALVYVDVNRFANVTGQNKQA